MNPNAVNERESRSWGGAVNVMIFWQPWKKRRNGALQSEGDIVEKPIEIGG